VTFWIDGDHRIRWIRIIGPILTAVDPASARRSDCTNVTEPVTNEP
jgi:hypothetical protein